MKILYTWGKGKTGNTCHNVDKKLPTPPSVLISLNLDQLSMGANHSAAIVNGECLMWGEVMGRKHTTLFKIVWKKVVISVSCGFNHTLLLTDDRRVFSMGFNGCGQLGVDIAESAVPQPITSLPSNVVKVVAGNQVSAAISDAGQMYTWGSCKYGQLANGRQSDRNHQTTPNAIFQPIDKSEVRWKKVVFGDQHTLALTMEGAIYAWGMNARGQLGLGHNNDKLAPVPLDQLSTVVGYKMPAIDIVAGSLHSAALTQDGVTFMWGANSYGQLGNGGVEDNNTPTRVQVDVEDKRIHSIVLGANHSILLTVSGEVYTFGCGESHQLGHGNSRTRMWPSLIVKPKLRASAIFAAGDCSALFVEDDQSIISGLDIERSIAPQIGRRNLSVFVGTWNCNGKRSTNLASWLLSNSFAPDIIAIGLQEIVNMKAGAIVKATANDKQNNKENAYHPWKHDIEQTLSLCSGGCRYVKVMNKILVGLMILIFVKEEHAPYVMDTCGAIAPCGAMGKIGNKGGVGIRFSLYKTGFCFINSHLAAGPSHERVERRAQDFKKIQMMSFENHVSILDHECLLWFGDLNYRIDLPLNECKQQVNNKNWPLLLSNDQLTNERKAGRAFIGFQEAPINFAPTYKYDVGTTIYDTSEKMRTPSYCDRILYRGDTIKPIVYRRHELMESDHRPVSALFLVEVKDYQQSSQSSGGWTRIKSERQSHYAESPDISANGYSSSSAFNFNHINGNSMQQLPPLGQQINGAGKPMSLSLGNLSSIATSKITIGNQHLHLSTDKLPSKQLPIPPVPPKLKRSLRDSTSSTSSNSSWTSTKNSSSGNGRNDFVIGSLPSSQYSNSPRPLRKLSLSAEDLQSKGPSAHRYPLRNVIGSTRKPLPNSPTSSTSTTSSSSSQPSSTSENGTGTNRGIVNEVSLTEGDDDSNNINLPTTESSHVIILPGGMGDSFTSSIESNLSDLMCSPPLLVNGGGGSSGTNNNNGGIGINDRNIPESTSSFTPIIVDDSKQIQEDPNFLDIYSSDSDDSESSDSVSDCCELPDTTPVNSTCHLEDLPLNFSLSVSEEDEENNNNNNIDKKQHCKNNSYNSDEEYFETVDDTKLINVKSDQKTSNNHNNNNNSTHSLRHSGANIQTFFGEENSLDTLLIEKYIPLNSSSDLNSSNDSTSSNNNNNSHSPSSKSQTKWTPSKIILGNQRKKE